MLNRPIQAVLFDLDGVLIDSRRAWHRTIDDGAQATGHPAVSYERFRDTFGQGVEADRRDFFPSLSLPEVNTLYERTFIRHVHHIEVMPGAANLLATLGDRGYLRALVTNTPSPLAHQVLKQKGLADHLEAVAAGGDAPEKPRPDLVRLALKKLDVDAGAAVYVGDSPSDRGATLAANVYFFGFGGVEGDATIEQLSQLLERIPPRSAA